MIEYVDEIEQGVLTAYANYKDHREIPLPYGWISISTFDLDKKVNFKKNKRNTKSEDIAWDAFNRIYEELSSLTGKLEFHSSFTEFLYPGSPGYGFSIEMPYASEMSWTDFRDDYRVWYSYNVVKRAYEKYKKIVKTFNNAMAQLENCIVSKKIELETDMYSEEYNENIF